MEELRSILLAEDNPNDVELTLSGLAQLHLANEVVVVRDGAEALDYLYSRGKYASRNDDNPAVILLDLKMPKVDGLQVLHEIKSNEKLKSIPVVMLTSSAQESDLEAGGYDLIISDYSLPSFDGLTALSLARELMPSVPFILFSGTIGEEAAIESLRNGATDYVLKQRPERLVTSLRRALREFEDRQRRQQAEEALREREEFFRLISENVTDLVAVVDLEGKRVYNSPSYKGLLGDPANLLGTDSFEEIHPEDRERIRRVFREMVAAGVGQRAEFRFLRSEGTVRHIESQVSAMRDRNGKVTNVIVVSRD